MKNKNSFFFLLLLPIISFTTSSQKQKKQEKITIEKVRELRLQNSKQYKEILDAAKD